MHRKHKQPGEKTDRLTSRANAAAPGAAKHPFFFSLLPPPDPCTALVHCAHCGRGATKPWASCKADFPRLKPRTNAHRLVVGDLETAPSNIDLTYKKYIHIIYNYIFIMTKYIYHINDVK